MPVKLPKQEAGGVVPLKVDNVPGAGEVLQPPKKSQQQLFLDRDFNRFLEGVKKGMAELPLQKISRAGDRAG